MQRLDSGKASLVEILAAIKFIRRGRETNAVQTTKRFAGFDQRVRSSCQFSLEDAHLVRSAN